MEKQRPKRVPKCGFCQNHGIIKALKSHKRTCEYFDCPCKPCINTRLRREHMADMQYIKRNGVVELERIQNALRSQEVDVQMEKKGVYAKIYQERMANKSKKRNLKSGRSCAPDLVSTGSSSAAVTLNSSDPVALASPLTARELPDLLADLPKLKAFAGANPLVAAGSLPLDASGLDPTNLAGLHGGRSAYANLFPANPGAENAMTSDQFLKAAKLLGLNSTNALSAVAGGNSLAGVSGSFVERAGLRNENVDLNEICEIISRLSIEDCLNNDEKVLNAAIYILFNDIPKALMNPGNVAEEIYSTFKQLSLTNVFR